MFLFYPIFVQNQGLHKKGIRIYGIFVQSPCGESGELRNRVAAGSSRELMVVSNEGNIGRAARIPLLQRRSRIAANGS